VNIKNMHMRISKFKKGNNGTVLIDCEAGRDLEALKDIVSK